MTSEIYHKKYVFSTLSKQYLLGQLYLTQEVLLQIFPEIVSKYHSDMSWREHTDKWKLECEHHHGST